MHYNTKRLTKKRFLITVIAIIITYKISINYIDVLYYNYHISNTRIKVDWHDRAAMTSDRLKIGLGEQGVVSYLPKNTIFNETIPFTLNGFNAHLSDMISLTRSVPDTRNPVCNTIKYLSDLPSVSVIIPFFNEHLSVLLRSIYSVLQRSPTKLIHEIIIVDDFSDKDFLGEKLDDFVAKNLPKVKIVRHKKRKGLIAARVSGAKIAKAEVLVFLDAHVETNYNWLPPLLEPIAYNRKIVVFPLIDSINCDTFNYLAEDDGALGLFDWGFGYYRIPLPSADLIDRTKPYRSPVMNGGLFSINRKWFWQLGGYDTGLAIWGGEELELSFKIWMCGGELLEAPCSRVGHIFHGHQISKNPRTTDFIDGNYKRIAEVWMDEYAQFVYNNQVTNYDPLDVNNLSDRREIRKRLNCKSFDWYMKNIAFDVLIYSPVKPLRYFSGSLRSMAKQNLCLDTLNRDRGESPGFYSCYSEDADGNSNQNWEISWRKELKLHSVDVCLEVSAHYKDGKISVHTCHGRQGNQVWFYDHYNKLLEQGNSGYCMEASITNGIVYMNKCNNSNINMQWKFGFHNIDRLNNLHNVFP